MAFTRFDDSEGMDRMREFITPGMVDNAVRQTIHLVFAALPKERRTLAEAEQTMRQLVDRAFEDFRKDSESFGLNG
jgi:hypothetical protein